MTGNQRENEERGRRPFIAENGEVHGSGAGAGGGNPGEDYDDDAISGGGDLTDANLVDPEKAGVVDAEEK